MSSTKSSEEDNYKIFPKRNGRTDGSFRKFQPQTFFTNFYEINLKTQKMSIYQYSLKLNSDFPEDSELYRKSIKSIQRNLQKSIGYLFHKGAMLWGTKQSKITMNQSCVFTNQDKKYSLEATITPSKEVSLKDLNNPQLRPQLLQILNIGLKKNLKKANLFELGKSSKYFKTDQIDQHPDLGQIGLDVIRGFKFTLVQLNRGIYLQIDTCSRILQSENLLRICYRFNLDLCSFNDTSIITRYGKYKTYNKIQMDFSKNPRSQFYNQAKGINMTYEEYYRDIYDLPVTDHKQPLIKVVGRVKKSLNQAGNFEQKEEYIYLLPEFVSPTGMTESQVADHRIMQAIAPYTKLNPNQRIKNCDDIISTLNQFDSIIQIKNNIKMDGYQLPKPELKFGQGIIKPDNKGIIKNRDLLEEPCNFTDWMLVYSHGNNPKRDDDEADSAVDLLMKAGQAYGIKFKDPGFLTMNSNKVCDWINDIDKDIKKNGKPQIIVVFLTPHQSKKNFYPELKKYFINQLCCASQFIVRKTLQNPKGALSAASKICIQMNVKAGCTPWKVNTFHPYFRERTCMYGAISMSKCSKGKHTLAFVGTINPEFTKTYSICKIGIETKEAIPAKDLQSIFYDWAKTFFMKNKKIPDTIILYRQGLSDPQAEAQLPRSEIPALQGMIKTIGLKTKTKNYDPEVSLVLVNKKVNSRFFSMGRNNSRQQKFVPDLFNPDSGSVIIEPMSDNDAYDFHLASQLVTQGTCTPTQFKVAYDTTNMPQEALIEFTFNQCFNYYNWQGAVRVPACLQCANKLSKLVGESLKSDVVQSNLTKTHFFL